MNSKTRFLTLLISIIALSGCKQVYKDMLNLMNSIKVDKKEVEVLSNGSYTLEEMEKVALYFRKVNKLALGVINDPKVPKKIGKYLDKQDIPKLCSELLIDSKTYKEIIDSCDVNGFFTCSEETKYYKGFVTAFVKKLPSDVRAEFQNTPECQVTN